MELLRLFRRLTGRCPDCGGFKEPTIGEAANWHKWKCIDCRREFD